MARLADFGREVILSQGPAWAAYEGQGWLVPALGIDLDVNMDGRPALGLSLLRGALPFRPPDPFARLDCTVVCTVDTSSALGDLRQHFPEATATPIWPDRSQISMGDSLFSADGGSGVVLAGSRTARFIQDMSWEGGQAIAAMLRAGENPLLFSGAAGFIGVSPRVATNVTASPDTIAALQAALPNDAATWNDLHSVLLGGLHDFELTGVDQLTGQQIQFASAALADRILDVCGTPVGHNVFGEPLVRLAPPKGGALEWDLMKLHRTSRWMRLAQRPSQSLEAFLSDGLGDSLISDRIISSFPQGNHRLTIYSTFSGADFGLHALGVTAQAAANPPDRPASSTDTGILDPMQGVVNLDLDLALGEPLSYQLSTFAVGQTGTHLWQQHGAQSDRNDYLVALGPDDFGVQLYEFSVSDEVLAQASLSLEFVEVTPTNTRSHHIPLSALQRFILPSTSVGSECVVHAEEIAGSDAQELRLGELGAFNISAETFPAHGPQIANVVVSGTFVVTVGLEVKPIDATEVETKTVSFGPENRERQVSYFSSSLFRAGFAYRWLGESQWNIHPDPSQTLLLEGPPA